MVTNSKNPLAPKAKATVATTGKPSAPATATVSTTPRNPANATGGTVPATTAAQVATTALPVVTAMANGKHAALAVTTVAGQAYTVPSNGGLGVVHFVALHSAPTTGARPQCWPGLYSGASNATQGQPSSAPAATYAQWGVAVPAAGPATWAVVHVYPGKQQTTASSAANGLMAACAGGTGAGMGGAPCAATLALAAAHGLAAPKGRS